MGGRAGGQTVPPGAALVENGDGRWVLTPGHRLTFGRADCDIPLGAEPPDTLVSRHAGTLSESEGALVVANAGRHPLLVFDDGGSEQRTVAPGTALAAQSAQFDVVAIGRYGVRYELHVRHRRAPRISAGEDTTRRPPKLTPTEKKLLVALCEERLRTGSRTAPFATYRQIAERVGRDDNYVRNRLATVRTNLSALGVPGLAQDEPVSGVRRLPDFVVRLGEWAIAAGLVTRDDLALLDT